MRPTWIRPPEWTLVTGCALAAAVILPSSSSAQDAASGTQSAAVSVAAYEPAVARGTEFPLTIRNIMRGTELVGEAPAAVR